MKKIILFSFLFLFFSSFCLGDIYYWVDKEGIKHFSNISSPEEQGIKLIKNKKINKTGDFQVLKIYDGDTIKVKGYNLTFKVRLVGIDTPETGGSSYKGQPFSYKAKNFLKKIIAGKKIILKSYGMGGYNRQLAEVFFNGENINLLLLKQGLAEVYKGQPAKGLDINLYNAAQSYAKELKTGIWSIKPSEYQSPKQWRKNHPWK